MEILSELTKAGLNVRVAVDGDRIVATPKSALTPALRAEILRSKEKIIDALTLSDCAELDRLIGNLAELEGWSANELEARLTERRRMAAASVPEAIQAIRDAVKAQLARWPEKPAERAQIALCRLRRAA